jgi:hypothetical protein
VFQPLGMRHTGPSTGELQPQNAARTYATGKRAKYPLEVVMV